MSVTAIIELESSRGEGIGLWYVLKICRVRFYWISKEWELQRAKPPSRVPVVMYVWPRECPLLNTLTVIMPFPSVED